MDINQSLIKKFFYKGEVRNYCPYSIFCENIAKTHNRTTASMEKGNYFETLCLGSGREGAKTSDLPRKKLTAKDILAGKSIGEKTIDQVRIDTQHLNFERLCGLYEISVQKEVNTQVSIVKKWSVNDNITLIGELDIFPTSIRLPSRGLRLATIDLKLAADFTTYGEFCWGDPSNLDPIQGYMYNELTRDIDLQFNVERNPNSKLLYEPIKQQLGKIEPLFFFWVFNYKKEARNKIIEVEYNEVKRKELMESVRRTIDAINFNERTGWQRVVNNSDNCSTCAVLECPARIAFKPKEEHTNFDTI